MIKVGISSKTLKGNKTEIPLSSASNEVIYGMADAPILESIK